MKRLSRQRFVYRRRDSGQITADTADEPGEQRVRAAGVLGLDRVMSA